jgi:quercetin dioxygenase-like cupin family protein
MKPRNWGWRHLPLALGAMIALTASGGCERDETSEPGRRVVTGVDLDGKSTIITDQPAQARVRRPDGSVVMDLWRVEGLPARVDDDGSLIDEVSPPPGGGLVVKVSTIPPNGEIDAEAYSEALREAYGEQSTTADPNAIPGMHQTDTVDVVTLISGELYAVLEAGETLLRPGDTIVQRGTMHAWHNRSDEPATLVSVMMAASR